MNRHPTRLSGALCLLLACSDGGTAPQPLPVVQLSPAAQWSGGEVRLRSEFFARRPVLPRILAGGDTLAVSRVDDSTVTVILPEVGSGPLALSLLHDHQRDTVGTVVVYGESSRREVSPAPAVALVATTRANQPVFVGANEQNEAIEVDPVAGTSLLHPGLVTPGGYYGVGITYRADRFLLRDASDTLKAWSLWPVPAPVAAMPGIIPWQTSTIRLGVQMTDSTWLIAHNHATYTFGAAPVLTLPVEDPWSMFLSPGGDRLVLGHAATSLPGSPVFDPRTADTAYTITAVRAVQWADYSPAGDTLYLLAGYYYAVPLADSLYALDAATGQRLAVVDLPDSLTALTVTRDPDRELLYVHGYRACGPVVEVYAARTLQRLGEMRGSGSIIRCDNYSWSGIAGVDRIRRKLYVMWQGIGAPAPLWTFDLQP